MQNDGKVTGYVEVEYEQATTAGDTASRNTS
jgi:hypothetical protein